jgi:nicotinamide riboside transporter PnuC
MKLPILRKIVNSDYLDVFGALLILLVCVVRDFHGTYFIDGAIQYGIPISQLFSLMSQGAFPLGLLSILGGVLSLLSTRFISKQNNTGNAIGVFTSVSSGVVDFLFGNRSAVITYPISLFLNSLSFFKWKNGAQIRKFDLLYIFIVSVGLGLGFILVFLGAYLFGGKTDIPFLIIVSLTFGLSIGANFSNAFKYEQTWLSWTIYNIIQLVKNAMILNLANVVKYIFYLFNAVITFFDWKINGDTVKLP